MCTNKRFVCMQLGAVETAVISAHPSIKSALVVADGHEGEVRHVTGRFERERELVSREDRDCTHRRGRQFL